MKPGTNDGNMIVLVIAKQRLTHLGRYKMDAISPTPFSSAFSWTKMFEFRLQFHWNLFLRSNIPAMFQIMVCRRPGDKPLSEPMVISLLKRICVTRPQWVNPLWETRGCSSPHHSNLVNKTPWLLGPPLSLQLRDIDVMAYEIMDNSSVCTTGCSGWQQRKPQSPAVLVLRDGNPPVTSGSLRRGLVIWIAFPCHDVIM